TDGARSVRPDARCDGPASGADGAQPGRRASNHSRRRWIRQDTDPCLSSGYLARAATKPVLILCYANGIAGRLEDTMQSRGVEDRVQVRTFHSWCYWMLRTYGIPAPSEREYPDYEKRLAASVSEVRKLSIRGISRRNSTTPS